MMLALNHAEAATRELAVTTLCAQLQDSSVSTRRICFFTNSLVVFYVPLQLQNLQSSIVLRVFQVHVCIFCSTDKNGRLRDDVTRCATA